MPRAHRSDYWDAASAFQSEPDVRLTPEWLDTTVQFSAVGYVVEDLRGSIPGLVFRSKMGEAEWLLEISAGQDRLEYRRLGGWPELNIEEAERKAGDLWRKIHGVPGSGQIKVRTLLQLYQTHKLAAMKSGASTWRSLSTALETLDERPLASLTPSDVSDLLDALRIDAPIHANRALAYVRACFAWAVDLGIMSRNPAGLVPPPVVEVKRDRTPSLAEIAEIWKAAAQLGYPFGPAIRLLIVTGALREEIAGLRLDHLSMVDGRMRRGLGWRLSHDDTEASVVVPRLGELEVQRAFEGRPDKKSALLFSGTGKTPISGWSRAKRRLDGLIQADRMARLGPDADPLPAWRLNDLRRSFEQTLADRFNVYQTVIECCLGRTSKVTSEMDRAWATTDDILWVMDEALEQWAELLRSIIESDVPD